MRLKCVMATAGMTLVVGCTAGDAPMAAENAFERQDATVPITPGNYTAGNVDIVSPYGAHIRDTYKYEAWRKDATSPVRGHFHHHTDMTNGNANVQGDVLCFTVIGNRARIGGVVTRSNNPSLPVGSELTWSVADNTDARKPGTPDTASPLLGADAEMYCQFGLTHPESPLDKNNWVIVER